MPRINSASRPKISLVIPAYNEAGNIAELYRQIAAVLAKERIKNYEILFVDDGSIDSTLGEILKLRLLNPKVKITSFRVNVGKSAALSTGFARATGKIVITLDADLQDGPENIPNLIAEIDKGSDMAVGWRKTRRDPLSKTLPSKLFNWVVAKSSHLPIHDFNCGLKAMRVEAARDLILYGERHRFIPFLSASRGFKISEVPVVHHPRQHGQTKYGWIRIFTAVFDFLTVNYLLLFGFHPLQLFGTLGAISIAIGTIFGIYLSILHFQGISIGTRPLLTLSVLLVITGIQLISTGLIAEMITRYSGRDRPQPIKYEG